MKLLTLALIGIISCSAASAQTVSPFASDGCVPGVNAQGQFVDENGYVLDSAGWVATADHKVLNDAGQQVFLKRTCVSRLTKMGGNGGMSVAAIIGVGALIALAAGGASSTSGTN